MAVSIRIPVGDGEFALVDATDHAWLSRWRWGKNSRGYAYRKSGRQGVLMHRLILEPPDGFEVDHVNRDKLDNRRVNLRAVTRSANHRNRGLSARNVSGVSGVIWDEQRGLWRASITVERKRRELGRFSTLRGAVAARRRAEAAHDQRA